MAVGDAVIMRGDPQGANRDLAELQAVTAVDVQRVLNQYLLGRPHATIDSTQDKTAAAPAAAGKKEGQ